MWPGIALLLALGGGVAAAQEKPAPEQPASRGVLARVNGEELYVADVEGLLAKIHRGTNAGQRANFDLDRLVFRLVNDALLAQEARVLEMDQEEPIPSRTAELRGRLASSRLWQEEVGSRLSIDEELVERTYREAFRTLTLRIVSRRDRSEAEAIGRRAADGEDLEALARAESQDPYRGRGGLVDQVPWIDLPRSLADAALSTPPGELGGPVATPMGWTVFRTLAVTEADPAGLETRRRAARRIALGQRERELQETLGAKLRVRHPVEVDREVLDSIGTQRMPEGRMVPTVQAPDAVVATVGGRPILLRELGNQLTQAWNHITLPQVALALRSQVLDGLIFDELVAAEALRRGYGELPEVQQEVDALERNLLVDRYLSEVLGGKAQVSRDEVRAYYDEHRDEFRRPPKLHLSQITTATEDEAHRIASLARSGADFAWLARQHSIDRFRDAGGSRGTMPANQALEEFQRELANASTGDVFGPKGAVDNWRVVKVDLVENQGIYEFDEVSGNVRSRLADRQFLERVDSLIRTLRERSEIWVDEQALAALRVGGAEPPAHAGPGHGG